MISDQHWRDRVLAASQFTAVNLMMRILQESTIAHIYYPWRILDQTRMGRNFSSPLFLLPI